MPYRCLSCGRDKFTKTTPHKCGSNYRKRKLKFEVMKEFKGTKTPLFAHDYAGHLRIQDGNFYESRDVLSYDTICGSGVSKEEAEANAALFCNAYELLAALQNFVFKYESAQNNGITNVGILGNAYVKAKEVIIKAIGE